MRLRSAEELFAEREHRGVVDLSHLGGEFAGQPRLERGEPAPAVPTDQPGRSRATTLRKWRDRSVSGSMG